MKYSYICPTCKEVCLVFEDNTETRCKCNVHSNNKFLRERIQPMNIKEFVAVKDSGQREDMETGSKRDTQVGKGRTDLLPPWAIRRDAKHYENGAAKYGDNNWLLGQKSSRYVASLIRHVLDYMMGDRSEDHLAAIRWNAAGIMTNEDFVDRGLYPAEMHDMRDFTSYDAFDKTVRQPALAENARRSAEEKKTEEPKQLPMLNDEDDIVPCITCKHKFVISTNSPCVSCDPNKGYQKWEGDHA